MLTLIVLSLVKSYWRSQERFAWSLGILLLLIPGALTLSLINAWIHPDEGVGGYNQFKLVSLFLPLLLMVMLNLWFRSLGATLKVITGSLFILGFLYSSTVSLMSIMHSGTVIPVTARALTSVPRLKLVSSINIPSEPPHPMAFWNIMWEAYYLYPLPVFFEQETYYAKSPLNGEWWLERHNDNMRNSILSVAHSTGNNRELIRVNKGYSLIHRNRTLRLRFGEGWSGIEAGHRWTNAQSAYVEAEAMVEGVDVELSLAYLPLLKDNRLQIYLNDQFYSDGGWDSFTGRLVLKKGKNRLELRAMCPPHVPGGGEQRCLGYDFTRIGLTINRENAASGH